MGKITEAFNKLKANGEKALIPYITAGDPDLACTARIIKVLEEAGADMIELGVPFSDPMADGPTIQRAARRSLANGANLPDILDMVEEIRSQIKVPLILFGYYNPIFKFGPEEFAERASRAGIDGILMVDLPPEEADELKVHTDARGIDFIYLISPVSGEERIDRIISQARGFLYYVSVTGVTGARAELPQKLYNDVARVKARSPLPVAVGFGVSNPDTAARLAGVADGVVVGSALVNIIEKYGADEQTLLAKVHEFVSSLKSPLSSSK
jgi:tryptophan synthase alpha chain